MTTSLSFRADDWLVQELEREAERCGTSKSELLNAALSEMLYRLACERDAATYDRTRSVGEPATSFDESWIDDAPGTDWAAVFEA